MGKKSRGQSSGISVQNSNSGCVNKILNALDHRRHRWQNLPKGLPNKRQASGKHITDGNSSEPTADTSQPPDPEKSNKQPKNEQETAETRSKKFRIRSLISDEMAKRRGKHQRRRSSSPTQSPKKKNNSFKKTDSDQENETPRRSSSSRCDSPSTTKKKRRCDICAAMLTVSYLRQKANDQQQRLAIQQRAAEHSRTGLTKSVSFPLLTTKKTRDPDLQELKCKLRGLKDIQSTKDRFILPMKQWKDDHSVGLGVPKPMLTRPASFKAIGSTSRKDQKKQTTNQSKSLKQKIGLVIKVDGRKEKRRILMDAVFHKVPYGGRKSSKDPRKLNPAKLKTTDQSPSKKTTHTKKTSSTNEAMSKYRKLLSQTSTRDEKLMQQQQQQQSSDHKPKLFVAGDHSSKRKMHKRIRSLPNISPDDFIHNQEFPVKPTMDIHLNISTSLFDDQRSSDLLVTSNVSESNTSNHQNASNAATECESKQETSFIEKDEAIQEHDYEEQNDDLKQSEFDHQEEPRVVIQVENDKPFNEILGMFKKVSDERVKLNNEQVAKNTVVDKVQEASQDTESVPEDQEVSQKYLEHNEEDMPSLLSEDHSVVHENLQVLSPNAASCSEIDIPNLSIHGLMLADHPVEKKQCMNAVDYNGTIKKGFLHLDLESVKDNAEFQFVKKVLEKSGFLKNELLGDWYSSYQPIDPLIFEQTSFLQELDSNEHNLLLFDLINEALLEIHNTYCTHPLTYVTRMPVGCRVLEQVWDIVNMYLSWKPELQRSLDDAVRRDLANWMNLQGDAEFVGIELEELIVHDLLDELVFDDLLM